MRPYDGKRTTPEGQGSSLFSAPRRFDVESRLSELDARFSHGAEFTWDDLTYLSQTTRVLLDNRDHLAQAIADREHLTRRMMQSLDAYWLGYDGYPKGRNPRGRYTSEDWWTRFEKYRAELNRYCVECLGPCRSEA